MLWGSTLCEWLHLLEWFLLLFFLLLQLQFLNQILHEHLPAINTCDMIVVCKVELEYSVKSGNKWRRKHLSCVPKSKDLMIPKSKTLQPQPITWITPTTQKQGDHCHYFQPCSCNNTCFHCVSTNQWHLHTVSTIKPIFGCGWNFVRGQTHDHHVPNVYHDSQW